MKFIVVIHSFHVSSRGFMVKEIEAVSESEAIGIASVLADSFDDSFYSKSFKVIPIKEQQCISRRKLTLAERIWGWANL